MMKLSWLVHIMRTLPYVGIILNGIIPHWKNTISWGLVYIVGPKSQASGQEKGQPLPKFGEWDVNDPASADGFTVIFNKARDEKKTGGKPESPGKADKNFKHGVDAVKPQAVSCSLNP
ncbi:hypothetical protein RJ639_046506 [Escallonia herrerae]|uniref:RIN4 pathogenic type III effector avirulence factor Avr cleavage site domain-containing protein n=1 Tax=Escallonia herrerae TaxID=1293975 RepID=A0AA88W821_9ASTE|nr:hypothetical protein RJ639_046506 [Escallonia herrerae]